MYITRFPEHKSSSYDISHRNISDLSEEESNSSRRKSRDKSNQSNSGKSSSRSDEEDESSVSKSQVSSSKISDKQDKSADEYAEVNNTLPEVVKDEDKDVDNEDFGDIDETPDRESKPEIKNNPAGPASFEATKKANIEQKKHEFLNSNKHFVKKI